MHCLEFNECTFCVYFIFVILTVIQLSETKTEVVIVCINATYS